MRKIILYFITAFLPVVALAQSPSENYIKTITYRGESTQGVNTDDTIVHVKYFNGLGWLKQIVDVKAGGMRQDVVTPVIYDSYGRQNKEYLPYANPAQSVSSPNYRNNTTLINSLNSYYQQEYPYEISSSLSNPYSEILYDGSPLNRQIEKGFPGTAWRANGSSNYDRTIKNDFAVNGLNEVKKFEVSFPDENDTEVSELTYSGYYPAGQLYKTITKNENWQPEDGKDKTVEEFKDLLGHLILKRDYNNNIPHDTYYVYDRFSNLSYVIPPLASDKIIKQVRPVISVGVNYGWINLCRVDQSLADSYNKRLSEYDNADILNIDLISEYGGQGGFSVLTDSDDNLVLNLNTTTTIPLELKTGQLVDLKQLGNFPDSDLGILKGDGFEYSFFVSKNCIMIDGYGKVPSINLNSTFSGKNVLEYTKNYPWTAICKADAEVVKRYEGDIKVLDNSQILTTYTDNVYKATGGVEVTFEEDDTFTLSVNITSEKPLSLNNGSLFTLSTKRKLPDMKLGVVEGSGYSYQLSIQNNSIYVIGAGEFKHLNFRSNVRPFIQYVIRQEVVDGLCYIYYHDHKNRVIQKKVPDKGWEYLVYDILGKPILSQDQNLKSKGEWLFKKYDVFGRTIYTGSVRTLLDRKTLQANVLNQATPVWYESKTVSFFSNGNLNINYTNGSFPHSNLTYVSNLTIHTVDYYDNYDFEPFNGQTEILPSSVYDELVTNNTKTLNTGGFVRVLDTDKWIIYLKGFDKKAKEIFDYKKDEYLGFTQTMLINYDFQGNIVETKRNHSKKHTISSGNQGSTFWTSIIINDYYLYDHMNRLLRHTQQEENKQHTELITYNLYDELGRLEAKKVGGNVPAISSVPFSFYSAEALQTIDYDYNIRGWLTKINNPEENLTDDLFAFAINYDKTSISGAIPLYNGNISETHWKTVNDNKIRKYSYEYDDLNRLVNAVYEGDYALLTNTTQTENYFEGNIKYDLNGNILELDRYGLKEDDNTITKIDALNYLYAPYSNKLMNVNDSASMFGFKDGTNTADDYDYDANGNLKKDLNKGMGNNSTEEIEYNYLNLPEKITFDSNHYIEYKYDATGSKLSKNVVDGTNRTLTEYNDDFVYLKTNNEGLILEFFSHPEGYCTKELAGSVSYTYQLKDHQENIRLSFTQIDGQLQVTDENNFYPFGLEQKGYNSNVTYSGTAQKYKYNGKELEDELGKNMYSYGWRDYDPALCRFFKIDRFAEKYYNLSPYGYAGNNPVVFVDIQGDSIGVGKDLSQKVRDGVIQKKNDILTSREERIAKLRSKGKDEKADKLVARWAARDAKSGSDMDIISQTLAELDELEASDQVYNLYENIDKMPDDARGTTSVNPETGEVDIKVRGAFHLGVFTHELKHAYQFETGKTSFTPDGTAGLLYDLTDEYEAHERGAFFGGSSRSEMEIQKIYKTLRVGPINYTKDYGTQMGNLNKRDISEGKYPREYFRVPK